MKKGYLFAGFIAVVAFVGVVVAAYTKFTDVNVTGDLIVGDDATIGGDLSVAGPTAFTGKISAPYVVLSSTYNVAASTPSFVGQLALNGSYVLYVASGTANPTQWIKVGAQ